MKPEIKCPACGSLGWFGVTLQMSGCIETETGEFNWPYVDGDLPKDSDSMWCNGGDGTCEYEGTVADFKEAAKK